MCMFIIVARRKQRPLVEQGAHQVSRPCDVVEPGGIVVSIVANDSALESITLGEGGILERLGPDGIHISMSTVAPATAQKLAEEHTKRESFYVAAPVFGRPDAAAARASLGLCIRCRCGERAHQTNFRSDWPGYI